MKTKILLAAAMLALITIVSCKNNEDQVLAVRLDKTKLELVKGESAMLSATVVPDQDAELEWFSQDADYVTVDKNGLVTAVGLMKAAEDSDEVVPVSVYVRYKNGADECKVTVLPLPTSKLEIVSETELVSIDPGESVTFEVKFYPEDADIRTVTWSTDNAAIAKVNHVTGQVVGVVPGLATIKASYNDKIYDDIRVNVRIVEATAVEIEDQSLDLTVGQKKRLTVVFTPSNATDMPEWTSDNPDVATVDKETGVVTAKSLGTATIKVQAGKVYATCVVNVK